MEVWHIWIIISLLFFILEIFTPGFAVACLSIGAIGGAIATLVGWEFKFQLLVFAITSIVALVSVRPLVIKFLKSKKKETLTNTDALIGREAIVTETIQPHIGGRVKIDGDDWKAVCSNAASVDYGTVVRITKVDRVILTVETINEQ